MMRILFILMFSGVMALSSVLSVAAESYPTSDEIPLLFEGVMNTTFSRLPDGTWQAKNAEHLRNRPAAGYLKRVWHDCTAGQVAVGIWSDGQLRCGTRAAISLEIRLIEGSAQISGSPAQRNQWVTIGSTGAVIKTSASERAVWQFRDESVIRMDTDTAIRVQPKPHNGNTIAHAVLQRGILWGRVIGHEMHAENNGIIAGVRGTSFMMKYGQGDIAVYHSRTPGNPLDLWIRETGSNRLFLVEGLSGQFTADAKLEYSPASKTIKKTQFFGMNAVEYPVHIEDNVDKPRAQLLSPSPSLADTNALDIHRVRRYAREDIVYMNRLIEQGNTQFAGTLREELGVTNAHVCATGEILWREAKTPDKVCLAKGLKALISVEKNNTNMYYQLNGVMVKWPDNTMSAVVLTENPYAGKFVLNESMKGVLRGTKISIEGLLLDESINRTQPIFYNYDLNGSAKHECLYSYRANNSPNFVRSGCDQMWSEIWEIIYNNTHKDRNRNLNLLSSWLIEFRQ